MEVAHPLHYKPQCVQPLSTLEVDELLDFFTCRPRRAQIPNHLSVRDVQLMERGTPLAEQVIWPVAARAHVLRALVR